MSNKYLFTYCYEHGDGKLGFGSVTMTQEKYYPINQKILDDAVKVVREMINLPEELKIVPLAFHRFEEET